MKRFEHEVLTFDTNSRKGCDAMQKALKEWGVAGYELVSVTPDLTVPQGVMLFFKREITSDVSVGDEAA